MIKYLYSSLMMDLSEKSLYVFESLMEVVKPDGSGKEFEADNLYFAKQLGEFVGGTIHPSILKALVNRELLYCDGKVDGKNVYAIPSEVYEYYHNRYKPQKEEFERKYCGANWG